MKKYIEISSSEWYSLEDQTGYYKVDFISNIMFYKDGKVHNENGPARIQINQNTNQNYVEYWLDNKYYGNNIYDVDGLKSDHYYNDKTWTRFCKLKVFH